MLPRASAIHMLLRCCAHAVAPLLCPIVLPRKVHAHDVENLRIATLIWVLSTARFLYLHMQWLTEAHSEVATCCGGFKFNGQGQRGTPVTAGITQILMLLPGHAAAEFRKNNVKIRALSGR